MSRKPQIAIIGMGTFGLETARSLMGQGVPVCAVDSEENIINSIKDLVTTALVLDSTQEDALREAEIDNMDVVVVGIGAGRVEASIMTVSLLHQIGVKTIIARATSDLHGRILKQVGATAVVNPERDMGQRVARRIAQPVLQDIVTMGDGTRIVRAPVPASFVGHSLKDLDVRRRYNLMVLGIERPKNSVAKTEKGYLVYGEFGLEANEARKDTQVIMNPDPVKDRMQEGDSLLVMGKSENIDILVESIEL